MSISKADVILHPVRMRIIQSLSKRSLTVQDMMEWLPDIPQATLYRQLKVLTDNEIIFVADERKVRGTYERSYSLNYETANLNVKEASQLTKEEHLKYFITYTANLIHGVEQYLEMENINMAKDGYSYRQADFYLDDKEFSSFTSELSAVYKKYFKNEPNEDRRRRTVASIFIPGPKK